MAMAAGYRHNGSALFRRGVIGTPDEGALLCYINTTPLIDVMLVLLVTLIVSLPLMTHAVRLNMPQTPPLAAAVPLPVIEHARVLAAAQREGLQQIELVGSAEFKD